METTEVKIIIFDLEKVLVDTWHKFVNLIPDIKDLPKEKIEEITGGIALKELQFGRMTEDQFIEEVRKISGTSASSSEIKNAIRMVIVELPGVRYILTQLKKKFKLVLLSNFAKDWFEYANMRYGLKKFFDAIFVSCYSGIKKPTPESYQQVTDFFKVKPEECLLVDDKERNTLAAEKFGMKTVVFKDVVQLADELKTKYGLVFDPPNHIFRSYDIRGIYKLDLEEKVAEELGKSFGTFIGKGKNVCVARDIRQGGEDLKNSFIRGTLSVGVNVVDLGIVPTPVFYFAIISMKLDGGAMSTASHNPPMWNGFKMCSKNAEMISEGMGMEKLKEIFANKNFISSYEKGTLRNYDVVNDYMNHVLSKVKISRKLKVVLDPGNGTWCGIARKIFEKLGCEVIEINGIPDTNFQGRGPDPNDYALADLKKKVVEIKADFGAGFDVDGDRIGLVDNLGRYVGTGSVTVPIFASHYLKNNKGSKIVFDVPLSSAVEEMVSSMNGVPVMNKTGHTHIITRITQESAIFGGEYSNHLYFPENFKLDDGCFAALKTAELISDNNKSLAEIVDSVPKYPSIPIEEIYCPDEVKFIVVESLKPKFQSMEFRKIIDIDGIKAFGDEGWVLVRASNTMPQIKINSEGITPETARKYFEIAKDLTLKEIMKFI